MKRSLRASASVYFALALCASALCAVQGNEAHRVPAGNDWCVTRSECGPPVRKPKRKGPDYSSFTLEQRRGALFTAILEGKLDHVQAILKAGVDVNAKNGLGRTPLYEAAFQGALQAAKLLLDSGADPTIKNAIDETPLFAAVLGGNVELVRILVGRGLDVNAKSKPGMTPLHFAILRDDAKMVRALVELGADPRIQLKPDFDHFDVALSRGKYAALQALPTLPDLEAKVNRQLGEGKTFLGNALEAKDYKTAKLLLRLGADPNVVFYGERSTLNRAVFGNDTKAIEFLIQAGADPEVVDGEGYTALHVAVLSCKPQLLKRFLKATNQIDAPANDGFNPLHDAILAMDLDTTCIKLLLDAGADPNARTSDDFKRTALQVAVQKNGWPFQIIELLLRAGARTEGLVESDFGQLLYHLNYPGADKDPLHQYKRSKKIYEILLVMTKLKMTWKEASSIPDSRRGELIENLPPIEAEAPASSVRSSGVGEYDDYRGHAPYNRPGPIPFYGP